MLKRLFLVGVAIVGSIAVIAGPASAAPTNTKFTFAGKTADATLSNCGPDPAPGTECTVLLLIAAEERVKANGERIRDETLVIDLLDLLITGPDPEDFEIIGDRFGFTTDADVFISGDFRRASASAEDVQVDGLVLDISVTWVGVGGVDRFKSRETFDENGTEFRFSSDSRFREAVATAVVNGETFTESDPLEVPSFLSRSRFVDVCRGDCSVPI
jgi:hypothetical protein